MRDYLLFQFKDLQSLKPWPHHVINHRDRVTTEELGLLINQVLKNNHYCHPPCRKHLITLKKITQSLKKDTWLIISQIK